MKNKIKKFSKGDFRTVHPEIVLPVTNLEMTIGEGESCQGSFILKNRKEGDIRGLVYSSSFRIHLEEQGFEIVDYQLFDGRVPCQVAVIKKRNLK